MMILSQLNASYSGTRPCGLTIGSFDGVHRGHQKILDHLRHLVGPSGTVGVITFSNHPSHVLPHRKSASLISSNSLKLKYLEKYGADLIYLLEFTREFSSLNYDECLRQVMKACPFDFLVLGHNAHFGSQGKGTPDKVKELSQKMGFTVEYLDKVASDLKAVSSGRIRALLQEGDLKHAAELLGHPYELEGPIVSGGLIVSEHLCLPPDGEYSALVNDLPLIVKIQNERVWVPVESAENVTLTF